MAEGSSENGDIKDASDSRPDEVVCGSCVQADQCRQAWSAVRRGSLSPTGITLASAVVFLLPLITAIVGGSLAHSYFADSPHGSLWLVILAAAGLLTGVLAAWLTVPLIRKHFHDPTAPENNTRP